MMPSPDQGASHGSARPHPNERHEPDVAHLVCHCQLRARPRIALCGLDVTGNDDLTLNQIIGEAQPCVVCLDLARTALVARRCQRCPS